ncbi:MAG: ADP-ribosylation factor-directed GTPase activating protein isoform b, partial [Planctomycetaceae bacterium]
LAANLQHRQLSTDTHGAWQILHGVLAYGRDFKIRGPEGEVVAIDYLLRGGTVKGFELRSGDRFDDADVTATAKNAGGTVQDEAAETRGIRTELDPGSKLGQGHRDQWLAYMAACKLPPDQVIQTLDGPRRIALWVRQIEWNVPLNFEREYSWTLLSLLPYRQTSHRWTARDGNDYSIESLLRSEIDQLSPDSACGGSHRLVAISTALNHRKAEGAALTGVWADAQELVDNAISQALEFQNDDGSFSSNYFERPGWSLDLATAIGTTGHTLEFIAVGGDDSIIGDQAVKDAAAKLCEQLEQTSHVDLECGALYHALSGLQVYRRRLAAATASS